MMNLNENMLFCLLLQQNMKNQQQFTIWNVQEWLIILRNIVWLKLKSNMKQENWNYIYFMSLWSDIICCFENESEIWEIRNVENLF